MADTWCEDDLYVAETAFMYTWPSMVPPPVLLTVEAEGSKIEVDLGI